MVDVLVEADAALGRAARRVVLHAEAVEDLDAAVVHAHGEVHMQLALGQAQDRLDFRLEMELLRGNVDLFLGDQEGVGAG